MSGRTSWVLATASTFECIALYMDMSVIGLCKAQTYCFEDVRPVGRTHEG